MKLTLINEYGKRYSYKGFTKEELQEILNRAWYNIRDYECEGCVIHPNWQCK